MLYIYTILQINKFLLLLLLLVPFVVKHIVYKDITDDKTKDSYKENVGLDKKGKKVSQEKNAADRTQRVYFHLNIL